MEADTTEHREHNARSEAHAGERPEPASPSQRVVQLVASGAVGVVVVGAWAAREWLGPARASGLIAVVLVAAGLTWWPARAPEWWPTHGDDQRFPPWLAVVLLAGCLPVMAEGLRPLRPGQQRPLGHDVPAEGVEVSLWGRASGADLAPLVSYAGVVMVVVALAAAVAAAHRRRHPGAGLRGDLWAAGRWWLAGLVVAVAAAVPARALTDRVVEADSLDHTLDQPANRVDGDLTPAPVSQGEPLWTSELGRGWGSPFTPRVTVAQGWNVLVGYDAEDRAVVAVSLVDGTQRWRWERRDAHVDGITVDPAAGRVLVLDGTTALVLDLADGRELAVRRLPFAVGPVPGRLVGPDTSDQHFVTTGPAAVVVDHPRLAVIDVATAHTIAQDDHPRCDHAHYATAPTGEDTLILEWAQPYDGTCTRPRLLRPTRDGTLTEVATIPPPPGQPGLGGCTSYRSCAAMTPVEGGVAVVAHWARTEADRVADTHLEALAIDHDGQIRWRTPTTDVADELHLAANNDTLAVTTGTHLTLHDLATGRPRAQRTTNDPIHDVALDPTTTYATTTERGQLHAWTADDLTPAGPVGDPATGGSNVDVAHGLIVSHGQRGTTVQSPSDR